MLLPHGLSNILTWNPSWLILIAKDPSLSIPFPLTVPPKKITSHFSVLFFCPGIHPCLRAAHPLLCSSSAWLNLRVKKATSCLHVSTVLRFLAYTVLFSFFRHHPSNVGDSFLRLWATSDASKKTADFHVEKTAEKTDVFCRSIGPHVGQESLDNDVLVCFLNSRMVPVGASKTVQHATLPTLAWATTEARQRGSVNTWQVWFKDSIIQHFSPSLPWSSITITSSPIMNSTIGCISNKSTHSKSKGVNSGIPFRCQLHPWRLTWNIIMEAWKIIFLSKWVICRFHVNLPGCILETNMKTSCFGPSFGASQLIPTDPIIHPNLPNLVQWPCSMRQPKQKRPTSHRSQWSLAPFLSWY